MEVSVTFMYLIRVPTETQWASMGGLRQRNAFIPADKHLSFIVKHNNDTSRLPF